MSKYIKVCSRFEGDCLCCGIEIKKKESTFVLSHKRRFRLCNACGSELNERLTNGETLNVRSLSRFREDNRLLTK